MRKAIINYAIGTKHNTGDMVELYNVRDIIELFPNADDDEREYLVAMTSNSNNKVVGFLEHREHTKENPQFVTLYRWDIKEINLDNKISVKDLQIFEDISDDWGFV